jgi:serine/threonine-protein kinase RsbW
VAAIEPVPDVQGLPRAVDSAESVVSATSGEVMVSPQRLRVPNVMSSVETARLALIEPLAPDAVSTRARFRLELVLEEALMNRIWHAWPQGGEHPVDLELTLHADAAVLVIEDDGVAFDPTARVAPAAPTSIAEARTGGLGLDLSRKAARAMHYERRGDRNHLRIEIERN